MNSKIPIRISQIPILFLLIFHPAFCGGLTLVAVENRAETQVGEAVLRAAYQKLGIELLIRRYPAERAVRMAAAGLVDGELQATEGMNHDQSDLIQIKPAINCLEAVVFTRSVELQPKGWESLRPYRIGIIQDLEYAENNTKGLNWHIVRTYQSLFKMLENRRLDLVIAPRINGLIQIRSSGIQNIRELPPPIAQFQLFHTLHRKHKKLATKVAGILKKMKISGELVKIQSQIRSNLIEQDDSYLSGCNSLAKCDDPVPFNLAQRDVEGL